MIFRGLLLQVSVALRESTERSLIILDEFGKGTATVCLLSTLFSPFSHPPSPSLFLLLLLLLSSLCPIPFSLPIFLPPQVDGLSLLASSLRYWLSRGPQCPSILVSTHFHSVIQQKLLPNTKMVEYLVRVLAMSPTMRITRCFMQPCMVLGCLVLLPPPQLSGYYLCLYSVHCYFSRKSQT